MTATIVMVAVVFGILGFIIGSLSSRINIRNLTILDVVSKAIEDSKGRGICVSMSLYPQDDDDDGKDGFELPTDRSPGSQAYRNN